MAGSRILVTLPGEDGPELLSVGVAASYGVIVLNKDDTPRDLTGDTLTIAAKLDTTGKTMTFVADANQTTTGKGHATMNFPATELNAATDPVAGTYLWIDLKVQKSGGEANIVKRLQFTVEDSAAG